MKIDLVYCWLDGEDPAWLAERAKYDRLRREQEGLALDLESSSRSRFVSNDELRYSLRSVEAFAPWVNHIYIITDDHGPAWLRGDHPGISVVLIRDLLPAEYLPSFNSPAIETAIANIEGLSEHFLYANDDMLFGRAASPSDFFTTDGRAISRVKIRRGRNLARFCAAAAEGAGGGSAGGGGSTFAHTILEANRLITEDFGSLCGVDFSAYSPSHQIDAYRRTVLLEFNERYSSVVSRTRSHRFRSRDDLQRHAYTLYGLATGRGVVRNISQGRVAENLSNIAAALCLTRGTESLFRQINSAGLEGKVRSRRPLLLCLNDNQCCTDADRAALRDTLERLYPTKSNFEI